MISTCDMMDEEEREVNEEAYLEQAKRMGVKGMIMYSKKSSPVEIAKHMYTCIVIKKTLSLLYKMA